MADKTLILNDANPARQEKAEPNLSCDAELTVRQLEAVNGGAADAATKFNKARDSVAGGLRG